MIWSPNLDAWLCILHHTQDKCILILPIGVECRPEVPMCYQLGVRHSDHWIDGSDNSYACRDLRQYGGHSGGGLLSAAMS